MGRKAKKKLQKKENIESKPLDQDRSSGQMKELQKISLEQKEIGYRS